MDEAVLFSGFFRSENFGLAPYEMELETIKFQKQVVLAEVKKETKINESPVPKNQERSLVVNEKPVTNNEEPSTTNALPVSFRVQLAASVVHMDKQKLRQLSGLDLPVQEDHIDGFFKYTIGNEKSLQEAQVLLNRLSSAHFKKPFIVAYRQNERITVQQALMEINRLRP
jgi:hypothetical protein